MIRLQRAITQASPFHCWVTMPSLRWNTGLGIIRPVRTDTRTLSPSSVYCHSTCVGILQNSKMRVRLIDGQNSGGSSLGGTAWRSGVLRDQGLNWGLPVGGINKSNVFQEEGGFTGNVCAPVICRFSNISVVLRRRGQIRELTITSNQRHLCTVCISSETMTYSLIFSIARNSPVWDKLFFNKKKGRNVEAKTTERIMEVAHNARKCYVVHLTVFRPSRMTQLRFRKTWTTLPCFPLSLPESIST